MLQLRYRPLTPYLTGQFRHCQTRLKRLLPLLVEQARQDILAESPTAVQSHAACIRRLELGRLVSSIYLDGRVTHQFGFFV